MQAKYEGEVASSSHKFGLKHRLVKESVAVPSCVNKHNVVL